MKNFLKLYKKISRADFILILIIVVLSLGGILFPINKFIDNESNISSEEAREGKYFKIETENDVQYYPLDTENKEIKIKGPLGISTAEIQNGEIRMLDSPCPYNVCIETPPLSSVYGGLACLPNEIIITIEEF